MNLDRVYIVIPAYNEGKRIGRLLKEVRKKGFHHIVVVNDGSSDETLSVIQSQNGTCVLNHLVNLGAGASTMTGIKYALQKGAQYIATIDADHQHDPGDLLSLVGEIMKSDTDLLIGSRFLKATNNIPFSRIAYNFVGNLVSYYKTGLFVSDSQSGLKVMSRSFAEKLYSKYNGFEFSIDFIKHARLNKASIAETAVGVVYTRETMSKGQGFGEGLMMLWRLLNPFQ